MSGARLHLTDPGLLRGLMQWAPGRRSLTIEQLGDAAGLSKSKVGALLSGERPTVTPDAAERISDALGVHRGALFFKPTVRAHGRGHMHFGKAGNERERAVDADADRGAHELGEHEGPRGPYRRRP